MKLVPPIVFAEAGLVVTLSPEGDAVFRVSGGETAQLVPERAVALCFDLLGTYAPALMDAINREVRAQRLRLVQGGGPEDAA